MDDERLRDLLADPLHGIERAHRLLKDEADAVAAKLGEGGIVELKQIDAFEKRRAKPRGAVGQQTDERQMLKLLPEPDSPTIAEARSGVQGRSSRLRRRGARPRDEGNSTARPSTRNTSAAPTFSGRGRLASRLPAD